MQVLIAKAAVIRLSWAMDCNKSSILRPIDNHMAKDIDE
jgi:hypothetical protein